MGQNRGHAPNTTQVTGSPHSSPQEPQTHVDKIITNSSGESTKVRSTDPRDLKWGETVAEAKRRMRS